MGLRRHKVENLVLRGPVFYWRARIPVGFAEQRRARRATFRPRPDGVDDHQCLPGTAS